MEIIYIIAGLILSLIVLEFVKHMFFKKTAKFVVIIFVIFILFLSFSYILKDVESFKENNFIQTSAVISGEIFDIVKENVDKDALLNSTVKSNKLFKS